MSDRAAHIAEVQATLAEMVGSPGWTDGTCRVLVRPTQIIVVGKGVVSEIIGIPGLRVQRDLRRAGFREVCGPLLSENDGWLIAVEVPGTAPDAEAVAVVKSIVNQNGFSVSAAQEDRP